MCMKKILIFILLLFPVWVFAETDVIDETFSLQTEYTTIDIIYPVFWIESIDNEISSYVESVKNPFLEESGLLTEDNETFEYPYMTSLSIEYQITANTDSVLSLKFMTYTYLWGAHGIPTITTFIFNKNTGKQVFIRESALTKIAPIMYTALKHYFDDNGGSWDDDWTKTGTDPDPVNYSAYTITYENRQITSITFYFQAYQVAAYAAGMPSVTLYRDWRIEVWNY